MASAAEKWRIDGQRRFFDGHDSVGSCRAVTTPTQAASGSDEQFQHCLENSSKHSTSRSEVEEIGERNTVHNDIANPERSRSIERCTMQQNPGRSIRLDGEILNHELPFRRLACPRHPWPGGQPGTHDVIQLTMIHVLS